jgi:hypothetical protein
MSDLAMASNNFGDLELDTPSFGEISRTCERLAKVCPGDTRELASLLSKMSLRYYSDVLSQAKQSFFFALIAALIGVIFFISAAVFSMEKSLYIKPWVGLVAGALVQVISGTCFYLYAKASNQFATFHICLDRANRFVLANTLCEKLDGPAREETRAYLVHMIAEATLLTPDVVSGSRWTARQRKDQRNQQLPAKQRAESVQPVVA